MGEGQDEGDSLVLKIIFKERVDSNFVGIYPLQLVFPAEAGIPKTPCC
jgi:hypothetical protein